MIKIQYFILSSLMACQAFADPGLPQGVGLYVSAQGLAYFHNKSLKLNELSKGEQTTLKFSMSGSKKAGDQVEVQLTLEEFGALEPDYLALQFDSLIKNSKAKPIDQSVSLPALKDIQTDKHDAAVAIRLEMINQIAEHMYATGSLVDIDISGDGEDPDYVQLTAAPQFLRDKEKPGYARLLVKLQKTIGGIEGLFLKRPLALEFEMLVKCKVGKDNQVELIVEKVYFDTLKVDTNAVRAVARKKAMKTVNHTLSALEVNNKKIATIPTMKDILDIPVELTDAVATHDHLVLFTAFKK